MVRSGKGLGVVNLHRQLEISARPHVEPAAGHTSCSSGENEHDGPVTLSEHAGERLLIGAAGA